MSATLPQSSATFRETSPVGGAAEPHISGTADLAHHLVLPTILFMALGGMTWAVRGCSGFGAMNGCVFAGVTWGAAWWFIARDPSRHQTRRYSSGWIILALTVGIGISGNRGWMQWPSFFEGHLQLNSPQGKFAPIPRVYGFAWLFIAGVPWAGLGACLMAWCAPQRSLRPRDWLFRICCGLAGGLLASALFRAFPEVFLPLFNSLKPAYADLQSNPNLRRLVNDNHAAIIHLGFYLGFLGCETIRRDWKNVLLITTVGIVNGIGWALCQNWRWAAHVWPQTSFNWWRCWESCGGLSIGAAYGLAYFLVNRRTAAQRSSSEEFANSSHPRLERLAAYTGLLLGLGLSVKNGLKGWANIYLGNEEHWNRVLWSILGPLMLGGVLVLIFRQVSQPLKRGPGGDLFPHDYALIWVVLITQNVIAQLVTGPWKVWNEVAFSFYYLLLFVISALVVHHFHLRRNALIA
jgi:hypothetical protein